MKTINLPINKLPRIDALAFGFPCNDFSLVRQQKGFKGEFGLLYTDGVKVLQKLQPKWFLAENVGGLRSTNEGKALKRELLEEMGINIEVVNEDFFMTVS